MGNKKEPTNERKLMKFGTKKHTRKQKRITRTQRKNLAKYLFLSLQFFISSSTLFIL